MGVNKDFSFKIWIYPHMSTYRNNVYTIHIVVKAYVAYLGSIKILKKTELVLLFATIENII